MASVTDNYGRSHTITRKVSVAMVFKACERRRTTLDDPGFCIACGNEQSGCEPDARGYQCEACGTFAVYGCEELAIAMM